MKIKRNLIHLCLLAAVLLQAFTSGAQTVIKIAGGGSHSLFVKSDGSLWDMGDDNYGQLGDGIYGGETNRPEQVVTNGVTSVAAGQWHSLFLKSDGSLWGMGEDADGQVDGTINYEISNPEMVVSSNVTAIAGGGDFSLFLKSDSSLWGMGGNELGQLGVANSGLIASNVTAIAAGSQHSLFLKSDGSLWALGANGNGQLGDGTSDNGNYYTNQPEQIVGSSVTAIAAGQDWSLFLKSDGSLWAMGDNSSGQLGDGTSNTQTNRPEMIVPSGVTAISAGFNHSLFLKSDGSLWAMGDNSSGQLGDGTYNNTNKPEQIVTSGVTTIAAGGNHSLFIKSDGSLWAMGYDFSGQLGDGGGAYPYSTNRPEQIVASPNLTVGSIQITPASGFTSSGVFGGSFTVTTQNDALTNLTTSSQNWSVINTSLWLNVSPASGTLISHATVTVTASLNASASNLVAGTYAASILFTNLTSQSSASQTFTLTVLPPLQVTPANGFTSSGLAGGPFTVTAQNDTLTNLSASSQDWSVINTSLWLNVSPASGTLISHAATNITASLTASASNLVVGAYSATILLTNQNSHSSVSQIFMLTVQPPELVQNGGFETGDFTGWSSSGNFTFTSVTTGSTYAHSGTYGVASGPSGALGFISQTLVTTPGTSYLLSCWLDSPDGETPNEFSVSWNGTKLFDQTNLPAIGWTNIQIMVTATTASTVLQFGFRNDPSYFALDDVSVLPLITASAPSFLGINLSGTNLVVNGANGVASGSYVVLTSTNLDLPLSQWSPVVTNFLGANGNFSFTATNAVIRNAPRQFYILQKQ